MQYVKLKHHKSHYKSLRESPSDVAMTLMSFEANEDIITYLADTTTWEPARGTPWNDDKKKNSLVFVVDSDGSGESRACAYTQMANSARPSSLLAPKKKSAEGNRL